ncbi:hypothetical protein [Geomicrobium sp. JCM 19039]|uniref:hypothetical protein n=1 Tax=Geomicrobium sp. JCM 19039 TaxID=1460636 RepID=UPI00045F2D52|nr:hypothetical protein [Geomicrobium sp. JCM 19039]GAK12565.1 hypothetical protein JCM19039_2348 [Geomicrobium sp. JCM 19039]
MSGGRFSRSANPFRHSDRGAIPHHPDSRCKRLCAILDRKTVGLHAQVVAILFDLRGYTVVYDILYDVRFGVFLNHSS